MFQERSLDDLLTEFYADIYEENPLEIHRQADGEIQLTNTGDPFIDKWEEEMASGLVPNLTEMFSDEDLAKYHRLRAKTRGASRHVELQEAAEATAYNHPVERNIRERQEALARKLSPSRFPRTFGDD